MSADHPGLPVERLRRRCRLGAAPEPLGDDGLGASAGSSSAGPRAAGGGPAEALGQERALEALGLAEAVRRRGYNLFVMGPHGAVAKRLVRRILEERAAAAPPPPDWVYVNNFDEPNRPVAIELPAGRAAAFRDTMAELIEDLRASLPAVFESEDYRIRREAIEDGIRQRQEEAFTELARSARSRGAAIVRTPMGFAVAPLKGEEILTPEQFRELPEEERKAAQAAIEAVQDELQALMRAQPRLEKERRQSVRALDRETAQMAVGSSVDEAAGRFGDQPRVLDWLETVRGTLIRNAALFLASPEEGEGRALSGPSRGDGRFEAFTVNTMAARRDGPRAAPVVSEEHPTLMNLIGRVEHVALQGALLTNFTLIKPGALHRANGGYLLLDARQVLSEPFAWAGLKRALRAGAISIESPAEYFGVAATVSLEPDPVPLDVKVVMFGERVHYYLLLELDPEMRELFKTVADFEEATDWTDDAAEALAGLLATVGRREGLMPLEAGAAEVLVEQAARIAGDAGKLSLDVERLSDRLREADHFAREAGREAIAREDAEGAIAGFERRIGRLRERAQEAVLRDLALIDVAGAAVGQVNGLAVSEVGDLRFGRPARITARVRLGAGKLVDIEREVELGGPIHSKGVLILSGFLAARYALEAPVALAATLVLEQSYAGIEGDSASCAELFALLSALAELPLRQDLAVTGSMNQHGQVQPIGGVNEKIEGFHDICAARGLTGTQGVVIPAANVQHLMLREDVVAACEAGRFAIHPIRTVDEGIALLAGREAGERAAEGEGRFPEGSVNALVEARLLGFARTLRAFARPSGEEGRGMGGLP